MTTEPVPLLDPQALSLCPVKPIVTVLFLVGFWCWESWWPNAQPTSARYPHAARNLALAILNVVLVTLLLGGATLLVVQWTTDHYWGLLNLAGLSEPLRGCVALVLLDAWMYAWHRANHVVPFLWRFHRVHHSDPAMDVTTATRFHPGEILLSATAKLVLIPLLGLEPMHLLAYEIAVVVVTQFHHANLSLGRWDAWICWVLVTPDMHRIHHSQRRAETDSNYATVLSVWDRLFGSWRQHPVGDRVPLGLRELTEPEWQSLRGMLLTPLRTVVPAVEPFYPPEAGRSHYDRSSSPSRCPVPGRPSP